MFKYGMESEKLSQPFRVLMYSVISGLGFNRPSPQRLDVVELDLTAFLSNPQLLLLFLWLRFTPTAVCRVLVIHFDGCAEANIFRRKSALTPLCWCTGNKARKDVWSIIVETYRADAGCEDKDGRGLGILYGA